MEATGHYGYLGPSHIGPVGTPPAVVGGATAVMGVASTSLPPPIEYEHGYHEENSDTLRLLLHGGFKATNPATGSVLTAKPPPSVQQATPAIPDPIATFTIVVVVCIVSGAWIARYLVRLIAGLQLAA